MLASSFDGRWLMIATWSASKHRFGDIVGDEQDGGAGVARQHLQVVLHHHPGLGVEGAERLIHQDHVGAVDQRPGDRPALLHAARQLVGEIVFEPGEADGLERRGDTLAALRCGDAAQQQRKLDVFRKRLPGKQLRLLRHEADFAD